MNEYSEATHDYALRCSYTEQPAIEDSASNRPDMDMQLWPPTCEYQNDPLSALPRSFSAFGPRGDPTRTKRF